MEWCPLRYDMASISTGQSLASAMLRASLVAQYIARASPPSTRMAGMPYAGPLHAMPSPAQQQPVQGCPQTHTLCLSLQWDLPHPARSTVSACSCKQGCCQQHHRGKDCNSLPESLHHSRHKVAAGARLPMQPTPVADASCCTAGFEPAAAANAPLYCSFAGVLMA